MPQALVTVEQGELGAGVRALAAHDDAGAYRVAVQVDHAGQLGGLGGLTQGPVRVQGRVPDLFGQGADRAADRCGDCVSDRETQVKAVVTQGAEMCEERLRAACAVGADQDVGAVPVGVGDLREGLVEHGDVIGGGVVSGVARPQQPGHRLAGVDQETQQRVEPEAAFVGGCGLVFLGVAGDQRGVEGQDQAGQFVHAAFTAGIAARVSAACSQATSRAAARADRRRSSMRSSTACQQPPSRRRGGHRTEHLALIPQNGRIRDRLAAVSEHHCEIGGDPA